MSQYIVVHSDGETWERLEYCRIYRVTPKQMEQLENGDYPKWIGRCQCVEGADLDLGKLKLQWDICGSEEAE